MSAGAPVPASVLRAATELMPGATAHTPYGMTEVLPVADISLEDIEEIGPGNGVCVGRPVPGTEVAISPLDADGRATGALTGAAGVVGEVCIRAPHMRDGYDKLWVTDRAASQPAGWHRSGDVGHLDETGRLWIEGRIGDIITTPAVRSPRSVSNKPSPPLRNSSIRPQSGSVPPAPNSWSWLWCLPLDLRRPDLADEALTDRVRYAVERRCGYRPGRSGASRRQTPQLEDRPTQDRALGQRVSWRAAGSGTYESPRDRSNQLAGSGCSYPAAPTWRRRHRVSTEPQRPRGGRAPG